MFERAGNPAPRPILDVHNVKERGATGTVSQAQANPVSRARANARAPKAHGWILDVLRVVMRAICPSCHRGGGKMPCAGYSGFVIEPCSGRLLIREEPRYAMHAPTNCQPFGRSDRPVAALSAVAICDAIRIGFLRQSLKLSSAGAVFDGNVANSQEAKTQQRNLSVN